MMKFFHPKIRKVQSFTCSSAFTGLHLYSFLSVTKDMNRKQDFLFSAFFVLQESKDKKKLRIEIRHHTQKLVCQQIFAFIIMKSVTCRHLFLNISSSYDKLPLDLALSAGFLAFTLIFLKVSFGVFFSLTGKDCFESEVDFPYPELLTTPWGPYGDFFLCKDAGLLIFLYNIGLVVIDSDLSFFREQDRRACDRAHLFKTSFRLQCNLKVAFTTRGTQNQLPELHSCKTQGGRKHYF